MRKMTMVSGLGIAVLAMGLYAGLGRAADTATGSPSALQGMTVPSDQRTLSFVRPGKMVELLVNEGDPVKAGQVVAKQDAREEKAQLEIDEATAKDTTEVEVEKQVQDLDKKKLQNLVDHGGSQSERDEVVQSIVVDAARIKLAEFKQRTSDIKVEGSRAVVDKLNVTVPEDMEGNVQELYLHKGESAESGNMKLMLIVKLDPLRVEVRVPIAQAKGLKVGDSAIVTFPDKTEKTAKVTYKAAAGSSATQTLLVRMEMPNPNKDPSGENVTVKFPGAAGVARKNDE
jgi:multidrug efflux pump subunit AcrA (membrane-fusion protein)